MSIKNYFLRLKSWFIERKYFWYFLLLVGISLPTILAIDCSLNNHIISFIAGIILQLTGIFTIVFGVSNKLKLFKDKDLLRDFFDYLSRFPISSKPIKVNIFGTVNMSSKLTGRLTNATQPEHNFEAIIEYINRKYKELEEYVNTTKKDFQEEIVKVQSSLDEYKKNTNIEINELKNKVETTQIKGIGLELFGVACLIYGLILSSISQFNSF